MHAKISNGKPFGAVFTVNERKAMEAEIQRQMAEFDERNNLEISAMVLWVLHEEFGFGAKRLRRFFDAFGAELNALVKRYLMDGDLEDKRPWLCTYKLKELGIDITKWEREDKNG